MNRLLPVGDLGGDPLVGLVSIPVFPTFRIRSCRWSAGGAVAQAPARPGRFTESGIVADVSFSVLFVCTGNICRSPIAERLFLARIDSTGPVVASSAGTAGMTGSPMDAPAAQVLHELGGDGADHVARRLTPALIAESDLILTGQTSHRSEVVLANPMAFRRVFTLREFGRLGAGFASLPVAAAEDQLRMRVLDIASQRGHAPPPDELEDEISDPFGAPLRVMRACGQTISDAVDAVVALLGLARLSSSADGRARIDG